MAERGIIVEHSTVTAVKNRDWATAAIESHRLNLEARDE